MNMPNRRNMSTMERLFTAIFDRKCQIERQLHHQLESYNESLAFSLIADGKRPPAWLLEMDQDASVCIDPHECSQHLSFFWNKKQKTSSATWEFIQGKAKDIPDFNSCIHDLTIAPNVEKYKKSSYIAELEEFQSACSMDEISPTRSKTKTSFGHTFENRAFESLETHDESKEGEESHVAFQNLNEADFICVSDAAGTKFDCNEFISELEGSKTELQCIVEDNIFNKEDDILSLAKEQASSTPHVAQEILIGCSREETRLTELTPFVSQSYHTCDIKELFLNVDILKNSCENLVHDDVSEEGKEPCNATQHLHRCDITGISNFAVASSSCEMAFSQFVGPITDLAYTKVVSISEEPDISILEEKQASATPQVEGNFTVGYKDVVRPSIITPSKEESHPETYMSRKKISFVDTFDNKTPHSNDHYDGFEEEEPYDNKTSQNNDHYDGFEESKEPYDAARVLDSCGMTISDNSAIKPSCDEIMLELDGSINDLSHTLEEIIVFNDIDISCLAKERASITHNRVEETLSDCLKKDIRMTFDNKTPRSNDHCDGFDEGEPYDNKTFQNDDHCDVFEESKEPYDATRFLNSCGIAISDSAVVKPSCEESMLESDGSINDLSHTLEDNIVINDIGISCLAKEQASITHIRVEETRSTCLKDDIRMASLKPFEEAHHTYQCDVNTLGNKTSDGFCYYDGPEESEKSYIPSHICDIDSISNDICSKSSCEETILEYKEFSNDIFYEEDDIVCKDADILSLAKERVLVLEQLRQSSIFHTPRSKPSYTDKIDISDGFHSSSLVDSMNLKLLLEHNKPDMKHYTASSSIKLVDMLCNIESQLGSPAFERPNSPSASSFLFDSEFQTFPLSPPVITIINGRLSGKRSYSSGILNSNPELACFRIDENSTTTEENTGFVHLGYSSRASSAKVEKSANSKSISDATSSYQNDKTIFSNFNEFAARSSLVSLNSETESSMGFEFAGRGFSLMDKENDGHADKVKAPLKVIRKSTMSERSRVPCRSSGRIKSLQSIRGHNPSSTSYDTQIQQKQQQAPLLQRKKDIKVKALEAAEALKRLQDLREIEREKRKAEVKIEREKLKEKMAKEVKLQQNQKNDERRKKHDVAARKRQRDAEDKKVKDRKRQCIEDTKTLQREHRDKLRPEKEVKDNPQKIIDDDKQKGRQQKDIKDQMKVEREGDAAGNQTVPGVQHCDGQPAVPKFMPNEDNKINDVETSDEQKCITKGDADSSHALQEGIEALSPQRPLELTSYEMSPYQNSDDEAMERDSMKEMKYIPLWASEGLDEALLVNQFLDPNMIFTSNRSFNLSQVLSTRALWRQPLN